MMLFIKSKILKTKYPNLKTIKPNTQVMAYDTQNGDYIGDFTYLGYNLKKIQIKLINSNGEVGNYPIGMIKGFKVK